MMVAIIAAAIRQGIDEPDRDSAGENRRQVADRPRSRWPKLRALVDQTGHGVLAFMAFPAQHRAKVQGTNAIERLDRDMKRRADDVGVVVKKRPKLFSHPARSRTRTRSCA